MSRIYFHTEDGDFEVAGRERAHASCLVNDIATGVVLATVRLEPECSRFIDALTGVGYRPNGVQGLALVLRTAFEASLQLGDERHGIPQMMLNTALRLGSRPVRFLARMHAQCEIHGWADGPNREWLAEIIREGIRDKVMRPGSGWEELSAGLRTGNGPVVMSYSVCKQFPNPGVCQWDPGVNPDDDNYDDAWDSWHEIPHEQRWAMGMKALRAGTGNLELKPEDFDTYFFGSGLSGLDLHELLSREEADVR